MRGEQGGGLNHQDFFRARVAFCAGGDEGQRRNGAKQAVVGKSFLLKADDAQGLRRVLGEGAALAALEAQPLDVHVGDGEGALPGKTLILREHAPVFIDARIAGEHEIGGRFAIARARIEVAAQASRALLADQFAAIAMLGDQFVGGGGIDDHQRAAHAEFGRRRRGHPQIFAKLDAEGEQPAVENQIPADRDGLPAERHAFRRGMPRLEPALLVEFAAARQMRFRHNAENAPTADGDGAVIQPSADFKRQTDDKRRAHGRLQQRVQRLQTTGKQRRMNQQIGARVAAQAKLRKHAEPDVLRICLTQQLDDFADVGLRIGQMDARHGGHRADHAGNMRHKQNSFRKKRF